MSSFKFKCPECEQLTSASYQCYGNYVVCQNGCFASFKKMRPGFRSCAWNPGRNCAAVDVADDEGFRWHNGCENPADHGKKFCSLCEGLQKNKEARKPFIEAYNAAEIANTKWVKNNYSKTLGPPFKQLRKAYRDLCGYGPQKSTPTNRAQVFDFQRTIAEWQIYLLQSNKTSMPVMEVLNLMKANAAPPSQGE